jgi:hypothetical protein
MLNILYIKSWLETMEICELGLSSVKVLSLRTLKLRRKKGITCQCLGNYDYIAYGSLNSGECKRVSQVAIWMNGDGAT